MQSQADPRTSWRDLPAAVWERLEQIVARFREAWRQGSRPRLGDYVTGAEAERRALLALLIQTDLENRLRDSDETRLELYLQHYPELRRDPTLILDLIATEHRLAQEVHRPRSLEDYLRRFPEQAAVLPARLSPLTTAGTAKTQSAETTTGETVRLPETVSASGQTGPEETTGYEPKASRSAAAAVPGYEILEELGRGGMGVVYKARQIRLNRLVALKMILHADHAQAAQHERFQAEAEAVARLHHANIVQIHEVGEHQGLPYFSLELCEGGSLAGRLGGTPLPAREAAQMVQTLAAAIAEAHRAQVIHRDLKPANVLLTAAGEPKITDFGLARKLDEAGQTASGAVMGTPSYMAPEQAAGRTHEVGPAADIYALGAILYECLTGRPPFRGSTVLDTLHQVLQEEPVPPRRLVPRTPRDLETICLTCLNKEARKRYPSAQALAEDLRRWSDGEPITARPAGRIERLAKWARRRPAAAALIAVSVTALLLLLGGGVTFNQQLLLERNTALAERQRAEDREADARSEKEKADEARLGAEKQERRAEWLLHGNQLALAQHEWLDNKPDHARDLLDACRWDFRGWECAYLHHLFHDSQQTYFGHAGAVYGVAFSPDGRRLASASLDRSVRVWDRHSRREVLTLHGHDGVVHAVAFSPDGRQLASASTDRTVRLWDASTGRAGALLHGHGDVVHAVCFSPQGQHLASASEDGTVKVWDLKSQREILTLGGHKKAVLCVAYSPDGRELASGSADGTAKLWDARSGREILTLAGHQLAIAGVSFSPDGRRLASASWDQTVKLWDTGRGRELLTLKSHGGLVSGGSVTAVSFSPDGLRLASASWDRTVRVWDASGGRLLQTLRGHAGRVRALCFSSDGRTLASASEDETLKVWDTSMEQEGLVLRGHLLEASGVAFSPDDSLLASASHDNTVRLWDPSTGQSAPPLEGHSDYVTSVAFRGDGRLLASASLDKTIRLWDVRERRALQRLEGHTLPIQRICFSSDGSLLASAAGNLDSPGELFVWDVRTGKRRHALTGHSQAVFCVAFHPNGTQLASGSQDRTIKIWDVQTGREACTLHGSTDPIRSVRFSADGKLLASGGGLVNKLGELKVWDVQTGRELHSFRGHTSSVQDVCFSPDGSRLASASGDSTVRLWSVAMGQEVLVLNTESGAASVAFSHDGRRLAAGCWDGDIHVWNAQTAPHPLTRKVHEEPVTSVSFSPDGLVLATGSDDRAVKTWDLKTGRDVLTLKGPTLAITAVSLAPDGTRLAGGSLDGSVRVWEAGTGREVFTLAGHRGQVHGLCFSPSGAQLVSCGGQLEQPGELKVWDAATGRLLRDLEGHTDMIHSVCFSRDGRRLASAGRDKTVHLWDADSGQEICRLPGHTDFINGVCFSPDGSHLASASSDHTVRVWDTEGRREVLCLRGHRYAVTAVAFHPNGRRLVSSCWGRELRVWDSPSGRELAVLKGHAGPVRSVCFDRRGRLASVGGDSGQMGELKLWDDLLDRSEEPRSPFAVSPAQLHREEKVRTQVWHAEQAEHARKARQWKAAEFHLDRLLEAHPSQASVLARRGQMRLEMGLLEAAREDFRQAEQLDADNPSVPWWQAHLCLAAGDHAGYQRACGRLLLIVSRKPNPRSSLWLAQACGLARDGISDWQPVLRLAEQGTAAARPSATTESILGRAYLRAGRYREALDHLQKCLKLRSGRAAPHEELLLALCYHHLRQPVEARRWLARALVWCEAGQGPVRAAGTISAATAGPLAALSVLQAECVDSRRSQLGWSAWLDLVLLQREAREMMIGPAQP